MFICEVTGLPSVPCEKLNKIVVETREKLYFEEQYDEDLRKWSKVQIGVGREIVKEIRASAEGLRVWNARQEFNKIVG